ncbi:MAG: hypothetical protein MUP41_00475, partial [Desulfobacterales bacterium]|nr:hypothetical protein [Desulfobacterales bacterium]
VMAFTRVDDQPIRIRNFIYEPDHIIILDPTLIESTQVDSGLKENGWNRYREKFFAKLGKISAHFVL